MHCHLDTATPRPARQQVTAAHQTGCRPLALLVRNGEIAESVAVAADRAARLAALRGQRSSRP